VNLLFADISLKSITKYLLRGKNLDQRSR